ncbi:MAG TPA: hypothetical protein VM491_20810 [Burkholderiaceae bacterium]|nr:hypothetical protein [Burkholderiaceae bacterium]
MRIIVAAAVGLALLSGCASTYYAIHDPSTGRTYYTREIDRTRTGAVSFHDEASGHRVTLQSSEIREVDRRAYRRATR